MKSSNFCLMLVCGLLIMPACNSSQPASGRNGSGVSKPRPELSNPARPAPRPMPQKNAADIAWYNSQRLMPVLEEAQRLNKPVFVEFHAVWCAPCKAMEEDVFTQPEVYTYFNTAFLNFRTDYDAQAGKAIAAIYEVNGLPSVLFLDPQGVVLERHTGMTTGTTLLRLAESAVAKMRN